MPYGVYIFSSLASSKSLKCVRSLTSFSVRSIVAVIFSEFARSSSGNFSRFAHASSKFLGFVSGSITIFSGFARASMCIILYISRGSLEVRLHFSPLRRRFEWLEIKRSPQFRATLNGVMICDSMNDLFTVNDKTASS